MKQSGPLPGGNPPDILPSEPGRAGAGACPSGRGPEQCKEVHIQTVLIFVLVVLLLAADAFIFFAVGTAYMTGKTIKNLREDGWTVEPPKNKKEDK